MKLQVQYEKSLHEKLKKLRKNKGLTQERFAEEFENQTDIKTSVSTVSKWESRTCGNPPEFKTLLALCAFYDCDLDFLIGRIEERRHDIRYIKEITGISESAIDQIIRLNEGDIARSVSPESMINILSFILSDERLPDALENIVVASAFKSAPKEGVPATILQADQDTYYGRFYSATRYIENILEDSIST